MLKQTFGGKSLWLDENLSYVTQKKWWVSKSHKQGVEIEVYQIDEGVFN